MLHNWKLGEKYISPFIGFILLVLFLGRDGWENKLIQGTFFLLSFVVINLIILYLTLRIALAILFFFVFFFIFFFSLLFIPFCLICLFSLWQSCCCWWWWLLPWRIFFVWSSRRDTQPNRCETARTQFQLLAISWYPD